MIINSNAVNINTMRSDAEIINLVKLNTANMMTRTRLASFSVNKGVNTTENIVIGTFDFGGDNMFEYASLMIEFIGTWSMTAGASGSSYCRLEMLTGSDNSLTLGYMSADRGTTTTVKNIRVMLNGEYPDRDTAGHARKYACGNMSVAFDDTFSGSVQVSSSNEPANVSINGTINIYGIK